MSKNPTDNRNQPHDGLSKEKTKQENEKQKSFPNDEQPEKNRQGIDNVRNGDATQNSSKLSNQSSQENEQKRENKTETQDSDKGKL